MYSKYTGVILKKHPINEADELLTIYTKESGKLRLLARGVRKIKSRLSGALESLNEIEFEAARRRRGSARSQDVLPVLISARAKRINNFLREDLKKFASALVGIETLYRITPDGDQNLEVYEALCEFLKNLGEIRDEHTEVRRFQLALLRASGYEFPNRGKGNQGINEEELDQFLDYVLEREIKSTKFLNEI